MQINASLTTVLSLFLLAPLSSGCSRKPEADGSSTGGSNLQSSRLADALSPVRPSAFSDAFREAHYLGTEACAGCHEPEATTYRASGHAHAFGETIASSEPEGGQFEDPQTGRAYRVSHIDGQLIHAEWLGGDSESDGIPLASYPAKYTIGSGRFSRSYLMDLDGHLVQSPATWYSQRPGWDLSPGYEQQNSGFERPIVGECLNCHVGRAEAVAGKLQQFTFHTQSIDCERCHGPGSAHREHHAAGRPIVGDFDRTIANPAKLTRMQREDICAQCHFHTGATIELSGRSLTDFRPGDRLSDYCVHVGRAAVDGQMSVVGHVEQMRQSACYLGTETLTCTTCHDPHGTLQPADAEAHYRRICLDCHTDQGCRLDDGQRVLQQPDDSCIACHMPKSETDLPHFAFTHHRIQRPGALAANPPSTTTLIPMSDVSHIPELEQRRAMGLAYIVMLSKAENATEAATFRQQAAVILDRLQQAGVRDADISASLARIFWRQDAARTIESAREALEQSEIRPEALVTALFTLGSTLLETGHPRDALPVLEHLVQARRNSEDWFILAKCREELGDLAGAYTATVKASEISPQFPQLQEFAANLALRTGRPELAEEHSRRAQSLMRARPTFGEAPR